MFKKINLQRDDGEFAIWKDKAKLTEWETEKFTCGLS